jgi:hypothetical protein
MGRDAAKALQALQIEHHARTWPKSRLYTFGDLFGYFQDLADRRQVPFVYCVKLLKLRRFRRFKHPAWLWPDSRLYTLHALLYYVQNLAECTWCHPCDA